MNKTDRQLGLPVGFFVSLHSVVMLAKSISATTRLPRECLLTGVTFVVPKKSLFFSRFADKWLRANYIGLPPDSADCDGGSGICSCNIFIDFVVFLGTLFR